MALASGGVDKIAKIWDCRMLQKGENAQVGGTSEGQLLGHEYAIRKVQWSPHNADILATASYDMTCRVWVSYSLIYIYIMTVVLNSWTTNPPPGRPQLVHIHDTHTEFVGGCGWSLFDEGFIASCGWDGKLHVFHI